MKEAKSEYDLWAAGKLKVYRFQEWLFQAYRSGSQDQRMKIRSVFPTWFNVVPQQPDKAAQRIDWPANARLIIKSDAVLNRYLCKPCDFEWHGTWSGFCTDVCPRCNAVVTPFESLEIVSEEQRKVRESLAWVVHQHCGAFLTNPQQDSLVARIALWLEQRARPVDWLVNPQAEGAMAIPIQWVKYSA